uniref:Uncharacterized protein n=1 Tax=Solanum tuberosum TaxID=4113 RepID=M1DNM8_SOLTU
MTDKALLECFYRGLGPEYRRIDDQICEGGMLYQHYEVVENLLDGMVATSKKAKKKHEWVALITHLDDLSNRVTKLKVQTMGKEKYHSLRECSHGKKQGGVQGDESLSLIQKKMKAQKEMLNEMKENIAMLNAASASHSMTIQL